MQLSSTVSEIQRDIGRKLPKNIPHLCSTPPIRVIPWNVAKMFTSEKTTMAGLPCVIKGDDRISRFDTIPAFDRQTDRQKAYINIVLV